MSVIRPIIPFHSIQHVELLLFSKFPKETKLFYETLGCSFQSVAHSLAPIKKIDSPPLLRLVTSDQSTTGFRIVFSDTTVIKTMTDPDERIVEFVNIPIVTPHSLPSFSKYWVTLLRTNDIERTKKFYEFLGDWQKEQHGTGPLHYSNKMSGTLFEIYPARKKYPANTEFIINIDDFINKKDELRRLSFNLIEERESASLFKDPDGRLVQVMKKDNDE